jgi:hypothetical protein
VLPQPACQVLKRAKVKQGFAKFFQPLDRQRPNALLNFSIYLALSQTALQQPQYERCRLFLPPLL